MVATLMLVTCAKEETPEVATIEPDPIAEARAFFENKSKNTAVDTANALHRQQQTGELQWSEAKLREKGDSTIIFVPLKTSADYFAIDQGAEAGLHQLTAQLRAFSTDGKNWRFDMVTYVPEGNTGGGFTGTVLEEGWFGGNARYARFYDGRILRDGRHPNGQINKLMGWIIDCYYQTIYGYVNGYLNAVYNRYVCEQVWHDDGPPMPEMYDPPMGGPGPGNNGGTSQGDGNEVAVLVNIDGEKVDPKLETKCFDINKPAKLTIYVQQPDENTRNKMGQNSVGHAFVGIEQGSVTRLLGFYPSSPYASLISSQNSEIHDNSNTLYHVSISITLNSTSSLEKVISYVNNYQKEYDLNKYNCADFAIGVAAQGGLNLPKTVGSYNMGPVKFSGRNPGDLGEDIRTMALPLNVTRTTTASNAPQKKGGC